MNTMGLLLRGLYIGSAPKYNKDGQPSGFSVLVAVGVDSYKVTVKEPLPPALSPTDPVLLSVRPFIFNGRIYYSGVLVDEATL